MKGIYQRGRLYWIAYKEGSRIIRESTGTHDRKLAEAVLAKRRAEVFEGRWKGRRPVVPLKSAIDEFLNTYSRPRKISWREDERILGRFQSFLGDVRLDGIDRQQVEQFLVSLSSAGKSPARANRYLATIKCFFNRCIDWDRLDVNPCRRIKMHPETPRMRWLDSVQITRLIQSCSPRLRPIVEVALLTGLRLGDILRLEWGQIHLEECVIRITQGKTRTPITMPISAALRNCLMHIDRNPASPQVFHWRGKTVKPFGWLRTEFKQALRAADLQGIRFHDLRHTAATQLRRLGHDLQVVQQLLGHKSIRMTLRYSHVHPEELRRAVDQLGDRLIPAGERHFTITSQSAPAPCIGEEAMIQNESINQPESESIEVVNGEIPQTVNEDSASSEDW